ncbi:hypothetical protein Aduo_008749 [Ancylostoma duodenale]
MLDNAVKTIRIGIFEDEKKNRPEKAGGTGFAAPVNGRILEDGRRGSLETQIVATFLHMRDVLEEWQGMRNWVIVWPSERNVCGDLIKEIVDKCKQYFEEGGVIVTTWTPVMPSNFEIWRDIMGLWLTIDGILAKLAKASQFHATGRTRMENGRLFVEVGSPECLVCYYSVNPSIQCAKQLCESIRLTAPLAALPVMRKDVPPRTTATEEAACGTETVPVVVGTAGGQHCQNEPIQSMRRERRGTRG